LSSAICAGACVWQRPQQFLSRFARKHNVLFIEEPFFDRGEGAEPNCNSTASWPNVTVACPHLCAVVEPNPELRNCCASSRIRRSNR